jgi:hypothetical protein
MEEIWIVQDIAKAEVVILLYSAAIFQDNSYNKIARRNLMSSIERILLYVAHNTSLLRNPVELPGN